MIKAEITIANRTEFFMKLGFSVKTIKSGRWVKAYHNRTEYVTYDTLAVVLNDKAVDADKVFAGLSKVVQDELENHLFSDTSKMKKIITQIIQQI